MDKRYFLELTNKLYRLSFFFPQKEPLRNKIREVADEILASLTIILEGENNRERRESAFAVEGDIEILNTLLELAKSQNWIEAREISNIQEDYLRIKEEIIGFNRIIRQKEEERGNIFEKATRIEEKPKSPVREAIRGAVAKKNVKLNKRQEKIIDLLKKGKKMQVKDFQEVLPTTKRTLRRDLSSLVDQKIVERIGSGNATYYSKIGQKR